MARERLLALVRTRVERFTATGDPGLVLCDEALDEAADLVRTITDGPAAEPDVWQAVGWLHWCRYLVLDEENDAADLALAVRCLRPLYEMDPDLVPPGLRRHFDAERPATPERPPARPPERPPARPAAPDLIAEAIRLIGRARGTGDLEALAGAVRLLRQADGDPDLDPDDQALLLTHLDESLDTFYAHTRDPALLAETIRIDRHILAATPVDDPEYATRLRNHAMALRQRYSDTGDPADLDDEIDALRRLLALTPADHPGHPGHPDRAEVLSVLNTSLRFRYETSRDLTRLDEAIAVGREALAQTPSGHPDRIERLRTLSNDLNLRHRHTGDPADIDGSIRISREVLDALDPDHEDQALARSDLAARLYRRDPTDPAEAVGLARRALALLPPGHRHQTLVLSNAAAVLRGSADNADGDPVALDEAIDAFRRGIAASPAGHPHRAAALANLADALLERYRRTGDPATLDDAAGAARRAAAETADHHPDRMRVLDLANDTLRAAHERTGDPVTLDEAVAFAQRAVDATPADDRLRTRRLVALAAGLRTRFQDRKDPADLDAAIAAHRLTLADLAEQSGEAYRMGLQVLGIDLRSRYDLRADRADLDEAIDIHRRIEPTGPAQLERLAALLTHRTKHVRTRETLDAAVAAWQRAWDAGAEVDAAHLIGLSKAWSDSYEAGGDPADLDEAIALGRRAVADAHPTQRATALANLAGYLHHRYDRTDERAVLDEAIELARAAVRAADDSDDPDDRAMCLGGLANKLRTRYERTRQRADLVESVEVGREVVSATPADHPNLGIRLVNLASQSLVLFQAGGPRPLLDEAVAAARQAVAVTSADSVRRATVVAALGEPLRELFRQTGRPEVLDEAVQTLRHGLESIPDTDPMWCDLMTNLAYALHERGVATGRRADLQQAVETVHKAAAHPLVAPVRRVRAATSVGYLAGELGDFRQSVDGYAAALDLLPALTPHHGHRGDQEYALSRLPGLASEAAASALELGDPERAVALLEQGRGVLLAQQFESRTDSHSRPPTVAELTRHAHEGSVVLLNVTRRRCDALAVTATGVRVVPLPRLGVEELHRRVNDFVGALEVLRDPTAPFRDRVAADRSLADILAWLWDVAAGPVLDSLGHTGRPGPGRPAPRVWWVPTRLMSWLPIHAAGHHDERDSPAPRTVLDRVVSSYTPTVRALVHLRARRNPARRPRSRALVVALAQTPGAADLPGVRREADRVVELLPGATLLSGADATRERVLAALPDADRVHFACHADSDPDHPSDGHLLVHDHQQNPLTVLDISRLHLRDADLAFLSACSTARPSTSVTDEAIHVTSAFQLAGYRHVIGTLWTILDTIAVDIAGSVYTGLAATDPARALHEAVRRCRDTWPRRPSRWAAHIHAGV